MGQEIILTHSQIHQDVQEMLCLHIHLLIQTLLQAVQEHFLVVLEVRIGNIALQVFAHYLVAILMNSK